MSKKSSEYWQQRFKQIEESQHNKGIQCYADIEKQYRKVQHQLETQINAWYGRFATNNGITLQEAKSILTNRQLEELKWDINQYITYGRENAVNGQWMKQLENASARYHISRLEALKLQTQQSLEVLFDNQIDSVDRAMRNIYMNGYYHTAYEIQKGVGVAWNFAALDEKQISKVIHKPWAVDGKDFSSRIWTNKTKLVNELNTTLTQNIILGRDPQKAIDEIARKMKVSKTNAGRLVMTEEAFFSSAAQKDCFKELNVEQYEIIATLDSHTSDICQNMDRQHFNMSQWEVGVTAPPFHVNCRTTTVPYFDDEFDLVGERAARDEDGKTYYVPANMKYEDWQKFFVESGDKSGLKKINLDDTMILNKTDKAALLRYKSFEAYKINDELRRCSSFSELSDVSQQFVKQLDKALTKLPTYKGNLLRTVDFSDYVNSKERVQQYVDGFQIGKKYLIPQYWSMSKSDNYSEMAEIKIYIQNSQKGRDISKIGLDEQEVVYERNSIFEVLNKVQVDGVWYILMKEV